MKLKAGSTHYHCRRCDVHGYGDVCWKCELPDDLATPLPADRIGPKHAHYYHPDKAGMSLHGLWVTVEPITSLIPA